MRVEYSENTIEDFRGYQEYLMRTDIPKWKYDKKDKVVKSNRKLKRDLTDGLKGLKEHKNSIFPKEYEYDSQNYKMYVDRNHHFVVFYTIDTDGNGRRHISVEKCMHSLELRRQLKRKGIEPLKDADESLLDVLKKVWEDDDRRLRNDDDDTERGKEEEVYDEKTGKKVKRIVFTGPQGGRYYKTDNGDKVYINENDAKKSLPYILQNESDMIPLTEYIKTERCSHTAL